MSVQVSLSIYRYESIYASVTFCSGLAAVVVATTTGTYSTTGPLYHYKLSLSWSTAVVVRCVFVWIQSHHRDN